MGTWLPSSFEAPSIRGATCTPPEPLRCSFSRGGRRRTSREGCGRTSPARCGGSSAAPDRCRLLLLPRLCLRGCGCACSPAACAPVVRGSIYSCVRRLRQGARRGARGREGEWGCGNTGRRCVTAGSLSRAFFSQVITNGRLKELIAALLARPHSSSFCPLPPPGCALRPPLCSFLLWHPAQCVLRARTAVKIICPLTPAAPVPGPPRISGARACGQAADGRGGSGYPGREGARPSAGERGSARRRGLRQLQAKDCAPTVADRRDMSWSGAEAEPPPLLPPPQGRAWGMARQRGDEGDSWRDRDAGRAGGTALAARDLRVPVGSRITVEEAADGATVVRRRSHADSPPRSRRHACGVRSHGWARRRSCWRRLQRRESALTLLPRLHFRLRLDRR